MMRDLISSNPFALCLMASMAVSSVMIGVRVIQMALEGEVRASRFSTTEDSDDDEG